MTKIPCKECNGMKFIGSVESGNSTPCPACHGQGEYTMTKQEELRKEIVRMMPINNIIEECLLGVYLAGKWGADSITAIDKAKTKLKQELKSQGVVIKAERELPTCPSQPADDGRLEHNFIKREAWIGCRDQFLKAGFCAYEEII